MSRSTLIPLVVIAAVMVAAAGCPSGDDGSGTPTPPSGAAEQPSPGPADERGAPAAEPETLPPQSPLSPIEPLPPAAEEPAVGPAETPPQIPPQIPPQTPSGPESPSNPLRDGSESPLRQPPAVVPGAAAEGPALSAPGSLEPIPTEPEEEPFDPIAVYGPIFVDWPRPKLALVITGRQDGYIEPCGCAGLDRMKGGMSRRHSLFCELRDRRGWPTVGLDVGGLAEGYGVQAELKFQTTVAGMRTMGYDAIALGKAELRLPAAVVLAEMIGADGRQSPFLSANVALFGFAAELTPQTRVVEAAGMKLGITGVLGKEYQAEIPSDEIETIDAEAALAPIVPKLKQNADYLILLAHATREESIDLARKFPDFDLVVTAGGPPEPPVQPMAIDETGTLLIEVGQKGMDAIVLGVVDDPKRPLYQRVPLDSRFPPSEPMHDLMGVYQEQIKQLGLDGLGIRPVPHPQAELAGKFVGSEACATCHEDSYIVWKQSRHADAYATLAELNAPRNFDPECISCHVVGWHPTEYFPYETGYRSLEETPELIDTGCETCHGPGAAHVAAENGTDFERQDRLRLAVRITKEESQDPRSAKMHCYSCHDLDNSPDFDFETYWPEVEHYEDEE